MSREAAVTTAGELAERIKPPPGVTLPKDLGPLLWLSEVRPVLSQAYLVKGVLESGASAVVYGDSNSGKTFFALDLALHIAAGREWRGHRVRRGLVMYIAAEGGHGIRNRLAAYSREAAWTRGAALAVLPQAVNMLDPAADTQRLIKLVKAAESEAGETAVLIVIDTLARTMPGGNENASEDMGTFLMNVDRLRAETRATALVIHHAGKNPVNGARGHSSLRAAVDTEILVEKTESGRTATITKQRDLPSGQRFGFDLVPVEIGRDPEDDSPVTSCVVAVTDAPARARPGPRGKAQGRVLQIMEAETKAGRSILPMADVARLAREKYEMPRSSCYDAITGLQAAGFIEPTVGGVQLKAAAP